MVINGNNNEMKRYVLTITDAHNNIIDVVEGVENINRELEDVIEDINGCENYEEYERERATTGFGDEDDEW